MNTQNPPNLNEKKTIEITQDIYIYIYICLKANQSSYIYPPGPKKGKFTAEYSKPGAHTIVLINK